MRLLGPCFKTGQFTISTPSQINHCHYHHLPYETIHHKGTQSLSVHSLIHNSQSITATGLHCVIVNNHKVVTNNTTKPTPLQSIASSTTTSGSSNSFSKVLANFPSQYLFAIGFSPLFSLPWNIPPPLYCTLKQYDSTSSMSTHCVPRPNYWSFTTHGVLFPRHFPERLTQCPTKLHPPRITTMPQIHNGLLSLGSYPFHSPLQRISFLFSFPLFIKMLQFNRSFLFFSTSLRKLPLFLLSSSHHAVMSFSFLSLFCPKALTSVSFFFFLSFLTRNYPLLSESPTSYTTTTIPILSLSPFQAITTGPFGIHT